MKLHTGVPYLDYMLDSSISGRVAFNDHPKGYSAELLSTPYDFGSIVIPNEEIKRSNVLIKGDPGSGKTILACQIARNLALDSFFLRGRKIQTSQKDTERSFVVHEQRNFPKEDSWNTGGKVIVPVYFSFEQTESELKQMVAEIFRPDATHVSKDSLPDLTPIFLGLKDRDTRSYPRVEDIEACLSELQHAVYRTLEYVKKGYKGTEMKNLLTALVEEVAERNQKFDLDRSALGGWLEWFARCPLSKDRKESASVDAGKQNLGAPDIVFAVFIDSINMLFDDLRDRVVLHKLLSLSYHAYRCVFFHLLEDYSSTGKSDFLYLARSLEFEVDYIIELSSSAQPYYKRYIEVSKSRYSARVNGRHLYKIQSADSQKNGLDKRCGFLIFWSIHNHFVVSRERSYHPPEKPGGYVQTGIPHLDDILSSGAKSDCSPAKVVPSDAFFLVKGRSGGHKLSLAYNILLGGLEIGSGKSEEKVLLFSFRDEGADVDEIAMDFDAAFRVLKITDEPPEQQGKFQSREIKYDILGVDGKQTLLTVVVINMSPGYLTVEEFLHAFELYIGYHKPGRVLFDNTNLVKFYFSELSKDAILFAALIRYLKAHGIISIVIDVLGEGSDADLSYGLGGLADYVLHTESFSHWLESDFFFRKNFEFNFQRGLIVKLAGEKKYVDFDVEKHSNRRMIEHTSYPIRIGINQKMNIVKDNTRLKSAIIKAMIEISQSRGNDRIVDFSILSVSNIRNKVYTKSIHGLTALRKDDVLKEIRSFVAADADKEYWEKRLSLFRKNNLKNLFFILDLPRMISVSFE